MDKMIFQFNRVGFCEDIHTKRRRAIKMKTKKIMKINNTEAIAHIGRLVNVFANIILNII
jgi:hypothetical protein